MNINKGHIFLFIVILFLLVPGKGFTQTIATGHISAEVIESISTSSLIVATLVLTIPSENNTNLQGPQTSVTPMSNSGVITLTSVNTFTLNVVLKSDPISVGQNDDLKIEPSPIITGGYSGDADPLSGHIDPHQG